MKKVISKSELNEIGIKTEPPKKEEPIKGYFAVSNLDKDLYYKDRQRIQEEFKGEVFDKPTHFPKGLGAEHPFDFKQIEKVVSKSGFVSGAVNKLADSIVGDFSVELQNPNAQAIVDDFFDETNAQTVFRAWVKEALSKGNGFIELDLKETRMRVMNANNMFVKRNNVGKVLKYNQFLGDLNKFKTQRNDGKLLIPFEPNEIAHLTINKIPNDPYGIGKVWPNERTIVNIIQMEQDLSKLISRKAGAPMHIKMGVPGEQAQTGSLDTAKSDVVFLNNRTEWITDANVDIKVVEFKDLPKNLTEPIMHYFRMFLAGIEVPEVYMGSGQLNEGIAKVQEEIFERMIKSIRQLVEDIVSLKIIRPLLRSHEGVVDGKRVTFDEKPIFKWTIPGEEVINRRIDIISKFLNVNTIVTPQTRAALEIELSRLMDLEGLEQVLPTPKDAQIQAEKEREQMDQENAERRQEEEEIEQPEVPGAKPNANQSLNNLQIINKKIEDKEEIEPEAISKSLPEKPHSEMSVKEFVNLPVQEIAGFNYTDYLAKIILRVNNDKFEQLSAITELDFENGLLSKNEIEKLRVILKDGFKENKTIREIENDVKENIELKDRLKDGKVISLAANRSINIVRTETVNFANKGLVDLYKENKIKKVRFLAALSGRTCPICEGLNGQVFNINELIQGINQPSIHSMCRCSLVSIVE